MSTPLSAIQPPDQRAAPEPRSTPLSPAEQATLRATLLHADTYLDAALEAQIESENADVLDALTVLRGIVDVAIKQVLSSKQLSVR
jgi:hypothetical protein